jgi:hypothetical protein
MKGTKVSTVLVLALGLMVWSVGVSEAAPIGTAFTYQGRLIDANDAADGLYDFEFSLFDDPNVIDGNQVGSTTDINDVDVIDGYFTVVLDFNDVNSFNGDARWLEIDVRSGDSNESNAFVTLSPRTELTPTPYAIYAEEANDLTLPYSGTTTSSGTVFSVTNTGIGYAGHFEQTGSDNDKGGLNVTTAAGQYGAKILNQGVNSYTSYGLHVTSEKDTGGYAYGIRSIASHNNSYAYGLRADATSTNSNTYGGYFTANAGGGTARGIYIDADDTSTSGGYSYGIELYSDSADAEAYGIYSNVGAGSGSTSALYGIFSYGSHSGTSGESYGMYSNIYGSDEGDSYGIYSEGKKHSTDTAGTAYGGYFIGDNDRYTGESYGLYTKAAGLNGKQYGLYSEVTNSSDSYPNYGLYTEVAHNNGLSYGLYTEVANNDSTSYGLYADLDPGKSGYAVYIDIDTTTTNTDNQRGIYTSVNHQGTGGTVHGVSSHTNSSETGTNYAGYFSASSNSGDTGNLYGIYAYCGNETSGNTYAGYFYKSGQTDYAGYFYGNVHVTGSISKSSGKFKIDHPLDPENKYLSHSFVESPDMMNVYNGNVLLDKKGQALVQLPEYFEALNRDFRYQLTCIGGFAPVYVSEEISENRFKIAGGKRGMKVSWQVTGVRHDPYAVAHEVQVEEEKSNEERGYYLNPTAYSLPEEKGIESVRNPRISETRQVAKQGN